MGVALRLEAHDLIQLTPAGARRLAQQAPLWVERALVRAPWVVVRRAKSDGIPVGVRGERRSERFATAIAPDEVERVVTPEMLAERAFTREHPVSAALSIVRAAATDAGYRWGPAGAAAFELASGAPVLHDGSDLDCIVRAAPDDARLERFARALVDAPVRIDVELVFGDGWGAALDEALRERRLLVKTADGPRLIER